MLSNLGHTDSGQEKNEVLVERLIGLEAEIPKEYYDDWSKGAKRIRAATRKKKVLKTVQRANSKRSQCYRIQSTMPKGRYRKPRLRALATTLMFVTAGKTSTLAARFSD